MGPRAGDVDAYLRSLGGTVGPADRQALQRVYDVAAEEVPDAVQGTSYGMAALLYRGKGLVATVKTRRFLSLYPYSGAVLDSLAKELVGFERTPGSLHYSAERPLPDELVRHIAAARRAEIDNHAERAR